MGRPGRQLEPGERERAGKKGNPSWEEAAGRQAAPWERVSHRPEEHNVPGVCAPSASAPWPGGATGRAGRRPTCLGRAHVRGGATWRHVARPWGGVWGWAECPGRVWDAVAQPRVESIYPRPPSVLAPRWRPDLDARAACECAVALAQVQPLHICVFGVSGILFTHLEHMLA